MILFWPKHHLADPDNYVFLLSKKIFSGSKYTCFFYHESLKTISLVAQYVQLWRVVKTLEHEDCSYANVVPDVVHMSFKSVTPERNGTKLAHTSNCWSDLTMYQLNMPLIRFCVLRNRRAAWLFWAVQRSCELRELGSS